jgi:energy-coupling factor transport system permease protein
MLQKAKHGIKILSILVTWSLENAIETADSMKARGYGLPGRSAFSIFRFGRRDLFALTFILGCGAHIIVGAVSGGLYWRYFPTVKGVWSGAYTFSVFAVYFALTAMPIFININEDFKWKRIALKI